MKIRVLSMEMLIYHFCHEMAAWFRLSDEVFLRLGVMMVCRFSKGAWLSNRDTVIQGTWLLG